MNTYIAIATLNPILLLIAPIANFDCDRPLIFCLISDRSPLLNWATIALFSSVLLAIALPHSSYLRSRTIARELIAGYHKKSTEMDCKKAISFLYIIPTVPFPNPFQWVYLTSPQFHSRAG